MEKMPLGAVMSQIKQLQTRLIEKMIRENTTTQYLNGPQINIIYQLWLEDNISISELSKRTQLANTSLTTMLDRLERQGQIKKYRNEQNRREIKVALTSNALAIKESIIHVLTTMHGINFNGFTIEEEAQVYRYLERIKHNLESYSTQ